MKTLVEGNTAFALQLYRKLQATKGNLAFSPYSISSAVAMACAGARGETARQMEQVLHFDQIGGQLHALFGRLAAALEAAKGSNELNVANSLWPQEKHPFCEEFLSLVKRNYGAEVTPVDYATEAEEATGRINKWVYDKTRHKITEIIGPGVLNADTRMVLANAIYFRGKWADPFPELATKPDKFYFKPDSTLTVPFMHLDDWFSYGENDELQWIALPYVGGQLDMVILLPRSRDGIGQLENRLTAATLPAWISAMSDQHVDLTLPKFKVSCGFGLVETLAAMGMKDAFDPRRADFSGMDGEPRWLYLSRVLHKAYVDVNEKGTEAAALTLLSMELSADPRELEPPRQFRADHPFLFLIRDSTAGTILFMGRVARPKE